MKRVSRVATTIFTMLVVFAGLNIGAMAAEDTKIHICEEVKLFMEKGTLIEKLNENNVEHSVIDVSKYYKDPDKNTVPERHLYRFRSYPYEFVFTKEILSDRQTIITEIGISDENKVVSINCFVQYDL